MNNYNNLLVCLKEQLTPELNNDITDLISRLEEEAKEYETLYFETRSKLVESDQKVENQKRVLGELDKVMKRYNKENESLRGMVKGLVDLLM